MIKNMFTPTHAQKLFIISLFLVSFISFSQTTYTVTTTADSGLGSLRGVIANANTSNLKDTILFAPALANSVINLPGGELVITKHIVIDAKDAPGLIIDGGWNSVEDSAVGSRIFLCDLNLGTNSTQREVTIKNLVMRNGNAGTKDGGAGLNDPGSNGGAIYVEQTNLFLENVEIYNSTANDGGALKSVNCIVNIKNSSFYENKARDDGGGLDFSDSSQVSIANSTIAYNETGIGTSGSGTNSAGAIRTSGATITLQFCTVAFNESDDDAAISGNGSTTISNSIILDNKLDTGVTLNCSGNITDGGGNWTNTTGSCLASMTLSNNTAIKLATTLSLNRGTTSSLSLPCDSAVLNALGGQNCGVAVGGKDQRGLLRGMYDGCEPGAYEIECFDSDNDGISNSFDLDDDNDGLEDIYEASGNVPDGDNDGDGIPNWKDVVNDGGIGDGSLTSYLDNNGNGIPDVYDTDGNASPNHLVLESDGDLCFDVKEAGFLDGEGDGVLGSAPISVDNDGKVIGFGGYASALDEDSNGILDFLEFGPAPEISLQPEDAQVFAGQNTSLAIDVTGADSLQWQVSTDGGENFIDLSNDAFYSGVTTDNLTIDKTEINMNGYLYRVATTDPDFACGTPFFSDSAQLLVNVRTVITNRNITIRVNKNK
ncbi:hypothetical protein HX109_14655 [Galbibacter sp. BG1]|uniref:hypothetical protein n=1 Tax=Galbibacter sp. BG1 TaxID=1170699 RepID=UPI0015BC7035|nr:hypothetical protein [Galbibacter sp. BG1]QLE02741.1 hypothetical protein HX109_14655 [Galbibacter sp. BG1]